MIITLQEQKNKRTAAAVTFLFFSIILILLFILKMMAPEPPEESAGILINFGTSDQGMGDVQPENPTAAEQNKQVNEQTEQNTSPPEKTTTPSLTQNMEDAPSVKEGAKETPAEPERVPDPNALFKKREKTTTASGSEGETGKPGDQGDPTGSKEGKSHDGVPGKYGSDGNSYELGMRKAITRIRPKGACGESGKVVVEIAVDRNGKVVNVTAGVRGTTNTASCLIEEARQAAMGTVWEPDLTAPEKQIGRIIYNFKFE
jgi:outer membrane biosynthesis protein TonB